MKMIIDGDSCSNLNGIISYAKENNIEAHIYCDTCHEVYDDYAETHFVEKGRDSADFAILKKVEKGDFVLTQDMGLASLVPVRGGIPMNYMMQRYSRKKIERSLGNRYYSNRAYRGKRAS